MKVLTLPSKYVDKYLRFVNSSPEPVPHKTYLELFMLCEGLLPKEKQYSLDSFSRSELYTTTKKGGLS